MDSLSSRLIKARAARSPKISQAELAAMIPPAKQSTVASWERGAREPDLETIKKLAAALGCAPEWLAFGVHSTQAADMVALPEFDIATITAADQVASLLKRAELPTLNRYVFPKAGFQQMFGRTADGVIVFEIKGDGMLGTYDPGEKVMVDLSDTSPSPPGTFLIWDGMTLVVRRLEFVPNSQPPSVRVTYDNRSYDSYERSADEVLIQGRVIGSWQRR